MANPPTPLPPPNLREELVAAGLESVAERLAYGGPRATLTHGEHQRCVMCGVTLGGSEANTKRGQRKGVTILHDSKPQREKRINTITKTTAADQPNNRKGKLAIDGRCIH